MSDHSEENGGFYTGTKLYMDEQGGWSTTLPRYRHKWGREIIMIVEHIDPEESAVTVVCKKERWAMWVVRQIAHLVALPVFWLAKAMSDERDTHQTTTGDTR